MPFALAGENVKLKVKGIDENDISRGDMICNNLNYCQESAEFKAVINILELPEQKKLLSSGYECVMHMHAIAAQVEISKVEAKIEKTTNKKLAATFLKGGERGICVLKVRPYFTQIERPICLEKYEFMPSLGRFTLRDEGKTIGYGEVTGIKPAKTLLKEQKEQLLGEKKVEEQLANLTVSSNN
jgi:peptide chain release factor subunit 3